MTETKTTPSDLAGAVGAWHGALLIHKPEGVSSFGVIEEMQRILCARTGLKRRELPKMGHGGTLDPFATGLLIVCVGRGVKLARYFLGSNKTYEGRMRFGQTTVPGDPTAPVSETSDRVPSSLEELRGAACELVGVPYFQTPPMHSAKKKDGKPLYELARQGKEIEREAKECRLHEFEFLDYSPPVANYRVVCSAGTYIRTLSQDFARKLGTVGMLDTLHRTGSGRFTLDRAITLEALAREERPWDRLEAWVDFDRMLEGMPRVDASPDEAVSIIQGRQAVLGPIVERAAAALDVLAIYDRARLLAIARDGAGAEGRGWGLERVFVPERE